jgi:hypothetical protein
MNINIKTIDIESIKNNIRNITENATYPVMFFDDMSSNLTKSLVEFKIVNIDKEIIDGARTESVNTYFESGKTERLYIDNQTQSLNFHIKPDEDILNFMGSKFYVNNSLIYGEFDGIIFKIKDNIVGRKRIYGLYQAICSLFKIIDSFYADFILSNHKDIDYINERIESGNLFLLNYRNKILKLKDELINIGIYFKSEIQKTILKINFDNINSQDITELNKIILNICFYINKEKNKEKLLLNGIISSDTIKKIIKLSNYDLYNRLSRIINLDESNILKKIFILNILKNPDLLNLRQILNIDDLEEALYLIYLKYYLPTNIRNMKNVIAFILTGAKRYGDWIQVNLGKKHYFFVQTKDYYCMFKSLLAKGPVCIFPNKLGDTNLKNVLIYNYEYIPKFNASYIKTYFGLHTYIKENESQITELDNPNNHGLLYFRNRRSNTDYIKTPNISRNYFYKYIKYKTKYNQLKEHYKN